MSSGCNCEYRQIKTDQWFYFLENHNAPENCWDWHIFATAYGPFQTLETARTHLADNHANPGGASIEPLPDGVLEFDFSRHGALLGLIESAQPPQASASQYASRMGRRY